MKKNIFKFQGEDTSQGIYLAAIKPSYRQDNRWLCDKLKNLEISHIDQFLSFPQLNASEIDIIHQRFVT